MLGQLLYKRVELEEGVPVQFLAVHVLRWDPKLMGKSTHGFIELDPETTQDDLAQLRHIAQCAREELARAKVGSSVWQALRFILTPPAARAKKDEPTWESLRNYIDYPEPDQAMEQLVEPREPSTPSEPNEYTNPV